MFIKSYFSNVNNTNVFSLCWNLKSFYFSCGCSSQFYVTKAVYVTKCSFLSYYKHRSAVSSCVVGCVEKVFCFWLR